MPLAPGDRLGVYEVIAKIGEGGMGEVYQARDTKLNRNVALKVLPDLFASDPDRLARFQREAEVLASLNHPNIATIHGLEESADTRALVLELVEGPTLAERIAQGPIPLDETIAIASQIANALEAAHEQGVIHRDLKPANVKVKEDGTVKVLDFGLAKALEAAPGGNPSESPTLTAAATQMGVIMGTAAYMAPEQAKGKVVDKRADVWAFGAVVYEMLTGKRAFVGDDVSDTLAAVLRAEVTLDELPSETPARLRQALTACLQRDPKQRVHDMADVRLAMEGAFETTVSASPEAVAPPQLQVWQRPVPLVVAATALVVLGGLIVWNVVRPVPLAPPSPTRFTITTPPSDQLFTSNTRGTMALSADGQTLVYVATRDGVRQLYRRPLDQLDALPIPGTEGAAAPFFSPDGAWIGYGIDGSLRRMAATGGPTATLYEGSLSASNASWGTNDLIVFGFANDGNPLMQVASTGGVAEPVTTLEEGEIDHRQPSLLPGGTALLLTVATSIQSANTIAVKSLETGERRALFEGSSPRYVSSGHIVFARENALWAVPFDADELTVTGEAVPVMEGVGIGNTGYARFAVAANGSLVYVAGTANVGAPRTLVWVDRDGREEELPAPSAPYESPRLSPDGRSIAVEVRDPENADVIVYDLQRQTSTRLTFDSERDSYPLWSPDGQRVLFRSSREVPPNIYSKAADGTGEVERVTTSDSTQAPLSWSADGQSLVIMDTRGSNPNLASVSLGAESATEGLVETEFVELTGAVSPDGRWMAYSSNESGQFELYVRPFPNVDDGRWQISRDYGRSPVWAADGDELFFRSLSDMMAVSIETEPTFRPGNPEVLFAAPYRIDGPGRGRAWDVAEDGRFLMVREGAAGETTTPHMVVVENWFQELTERVPVP